MAVLKCKMCGGDLNPEAGASVCECEYCGSRQTIPAVDNEKKLTLFARANRLRLECEFDKAFGVYESIVAEYPEEAEAYWGLVLCKYGIEYVDDPGTGKKIPTCHRSSFDVVLDDSNFEMVMEYADSVSRNVYRQEAKAIEALRSDILAVSAKESPFDIFICYKETDENGNRTEDSVLGQDIYDALTSRGYKVFFARITLEDKLGQAYEPYIFAALNSSKIMLVLGSSYDYINAVWVKNEWSRFLALMQSDKSKYLIPCYKDMDAYDMPKEFRKLQGQDMAKLGAVQDLVRGIDKLLGKGTAAPAAQTVTQVVNVADNKSAAQMERGYMALEDRDWTKADGFFEEVLNLDAKNARAYLGKTLAAEKCRNLEEFIRKRKNLYRDAQDETLYLEPDRARIAEIQKGRVVPGYLAQKTLEELCGFHLGYPSAVSGREHQLEREEAYWTDHKLLTKAEKFADGEIAAELAAGKKKLFDALANQLQQAQAAEKNAIEDLKQRYAAHLVQAEEKIQKLHADALARRENRYQELLKQVQDEKDPKTLRQAAEGFRELGNYKDCPALCADCTKRAEEEEERRILAQRKAEREAAAKKKKIAMILAASAAAVLAVFLLVTQVIMPPVKYNKANELAAQGKYAEAAMTYGTVGNYKDAFEKSFEAWGKVTQRDTLSAGTWHTVGLKADGTVVAVGDNKDGRCSVTGWRDIAAISAGGFHTVGLKADGTVVTTGGNSYGQCDVTRWTDIVAISAGGSHTVGLKADGTVLAVGDNCYGQCDVGGWQDIVAIAAGDSHTVGLKADGTVVAFGSNSYGQCDVSSWSDIVAIAADSAHTVGLKADGTVVAVGFNGNGRCDVSGWTDIAAISAGDEHTVGLKADGTVVATEYTGSSYYYGGQCDVSGWTDIVAISAGRSHTVGLKADGTVVATGDNSDGQCDVAGWRDIMLP